MGAAIHLVSRENHSITPLISTQYIWNLIEYAVSKFANYYFIVLDKAQRTPHRQHHSQFGIV